MESLINVMGELKEPEVMSFILLLLTFGDTLTALMWRNKKDIAIFSKTLWVGFGLNLFGASVPYLVGQISILDDTSLFVSSAIVLWTFIFGGATAFSLAANYKLYSAKSYKVLMEVVPKVLKAEVENKIHKHDNKGELK